MLFILSAGQKISIHALREEGDAPPFCTETDDQCISIHALREEGDPGRSGCNGDIKISIHALREEGDPGRSGCNGDIKISIHALREEGDWSLNRLFIFEKYFYPRPP